MYKTQTRMPDELAEWLKHSAKENHRSMNAQLVHLLERCKRNENEKPAA
nr:Arc family DNA-binding protein [Halomonas sp.]|tara:strand:+ start:341 stop:487 length:147 start_codon:yes stop_codon:yes gene_type:complete